LPGRLSLVRIHLGLGLFLTIAGVILNSVSIARVRLILPAYPSHWDLCPYAPLAPVRFFHRIGTVGLVALFILFATPTLLASRSKRGSPGRFAVAGAIVHITILLSAVFSYLWCLYRIERVMLLHT